jgi:hypothetical protein
VTPLCAWLAGGAAPRPVDAPQAEALAEAASAHGLAALLDGALGADATWPEPTRHRLREVHRAIFARGVRQLDLAARVLDLLEREGLRALPLKGAALAETHYDSVAERPMGDVDVLVLEGWTAAVGRLKAAGFLELERADHAWSFCDPVSGGALELHHSLTSCPSLFPLDAEGLWARSRPAAGQVTRLASVEDLLVQLSLHMAFQHGLVLPLVQHVDIARVLARTPPDLARLIAIARAAGAEPALAATLAVAQRTVAAATPPALAAALDSALPAGLRNRIHQSTLRDLLPPARASVARVRWSLTNGRRWSLVRGTLAPRSPGQQPAPILLSGWRTLRRTVTLVGRWGPSIVQDTAALALSRTARKKTDV